MKLQAVLFLLSTTIVLSACTKHIEIIQSISWMKVESQTKTVTFDLVSGWDGSNNAFNYNGYYAGGITLKVPEGWNVKVNLTNRDGHAPHNIIVTYPYAMDDMPDYQSSDSAVIKRAYTEDVYIGEQESMGFVSKEGKYWFFCGINRHGINDMWINFEVSKSFLLPKVVVKQ